MTSVVVSADRYSVWVVGKDANFMEDIKTLQDENKELKMVIQKHTNEYERLTEELRECNLEIQEKVRYIEHLRGMVEAFEICLKARK